MEQKKYAKEVYVKVPANTSLRTYIYGDFNNNGVANVDDPRPFDKTETKENIRERFRNPEFYHKSQLIDREVKLSSEIRKVEENNNARLPLVKRFLKDNPNAVWRIKSVPSTLKKLRERNISQINDVAGARILTESRHDAKKVFKRLIKSYPHNPRLTDNYYRNPLGGYYYAYHLGLYEPSNPNIKLEVQIKSKKMNELAEKMHSKYKQGKLTGKYKGKAKKLYLAGY